MIRYTGPNRPLDGWQLAIVRSFADNFGDRNYVYLGLIANNPLTAPAGEDWQVTIPVNGLAFPFDPPA